MSGRLEEANGESEPSEFKSEAESDQIHSYRNATHSGDEFECS